MASRVADASTRTGAELATLMGRAAELPNTPVPMTARNQIQVGLDEAVAAASQQASEAAGLVPPYPTGAVSFRFTEVMSDRLRATSDLRTTRRPAAGHGATANRRCADHLPAARFGADDLDTPGVSGDGGGGPALPTCRCQLPEPDRLHPTTADPGASAAFGLGDRPGGGRAARTDPAGRLGVGSPRFAGVGPVPSAGHHLGGSAAAGGPTGDTNGSGAGRGRHRGRQLWCAPVGGSRSDAPRPPAHPDPGGGDDGDQLRHGGRDRGGGDPDGHPVRYPSAPQPPRPANAGGTTHTRITLSSGSSVALSLPPLPVAGGHLYELAVTVAVPPQANPAGASQTFLIQISK